MSSTPSQRELRHAEEEIRPASGALRVIGKGEMAHLIRRFDWSRTPIGAIETWPDILLTTVNMVLASRHPMFLWWGPELIQFYNDGYRPSIRSDKHPSAVGQRGTECWPEIWPVIGPQIDAVMRRGESNWSVNALVPINRNGKIEEVYWTYGYSPVRDKDGVVRGTLVVCTETTEHVLSERRLRTLLGVTLPPAARDDLTEHEALAEFAQKIARTLGENPADIPFATLYLLAGDELLQGSSRASPGIEAKAEHWPLKEVSASGVAQFVEDVGPQLGEMVLAPWPEGVKRAYIQPLRMDGRAIRGVLVFGISPRLPFDDGYKTFFHVLGDRIAGLLQREVHRLELAEASRRFGSLADANPFGMVIGNLSGELEYVNRVLLETLGYSQDDVRAGKVRWDDLTPPEYAEQDALAVKQLREKGRCDVYEKVYMAKDGRRVPILLGAASIERPGTPVEIAAFVTDLTPLKAAEEALRRANEKLEEKVAERTAELKQEVVERKRAEDHLRELTGRLLRSQDEERRHMARELHDHAGQSLVALGMNLSALVRAVGAREPEAARLATEGRRLAEDLSREIRTLSYLLHPPLLDEVGLRSAIQWYVDGFSERSKIKVDLELPEELGLPKDLELVIFRVVQESLTNVHRHAESTWAGIYLRNVRDAVEFEICDRGKGLSGEMGSARAGVGVRGMEERVRQFGGTLEIQSSAEGTKVVGWMPVAKKGGPD